VYTNKYKKLIKHELPAKQMRVKKNRTLFWRENRSVHHNTELKTWKQVTWQGEQHECNVNGTKQKTMHFPQVIDNIYRVHLIFT